MLTTLDNCIPKMNLQKPVKWSFLPLENGRSLINRQVIVVLYRKAKGFDCRLQFVAFERHWPRSSIPKTTHRQMSFKVKGQYLRLFDNVSKVGCISPMVIWSEFQMWKYGDNDSREDAPHFIPTLVRFLLRLLLMIYGLLIFAK